MLFQTVSALNYLPLTFALARSLYRHIPEARLSILVTDASSSTTAKLNQIYSDIAEFISCDDLGIDYLHSLRSYYNVLEFSSACKVLALDYQLRVRGEPECCFIDPDMLVLGNFIPAIRAANKEMLVTYHSTAPYPEDGELPNELELTTTGTINGGFIYSKNTPAALAALHWLTSQTRYRWFVAPAYGMYGDQHWLSFLTLFFPETADIIHATGINIAYWNLHERTLTQQGDTYTVGKEPALLFHFSGFGGDRLSKHCNRRFAESEGAINQLVHDYNAALANERALLATNPFTSDYGFATLPLQKRLKMAAQQWKTSYPLLTHPGGIFARLGMKLDKLLG